MRNWKLWVLCNYITRAGRSESGLAGTGVARQRDIPGTGLNSCTVKVKPPRDKKISQWETDRSLWLSGMLAQWSLPGCLTTGREMQWFTLKLMKAHWHSADEGAVCTGCGMECYQCLMICQWWKPLKSRTAICLHIRGLEVVCRIRCGEVNVHIAGISVQTMA